MRIKIISVEQIRTEKPLEELWLQLRLFESECYSRQFLKEKYHDITDEELTKLLATLTSNIKQAHEYYSAASSVSILTSPLLYYYGMMCLINVLWASLNKTKEIGSSHGLWSKPDGLDHLLSNECVTTFKKGLFPALHACFSDYSIKKNTKFHIKDILSVIPELKTLYEKIYNESSRLFKLKRNDFHLIFDQNDYHYFQDFLKNHQNDFFQQYNVGFFSNFFDEIVGMDYDNNDLFEYPLQKSINEDIYFTLPIEADNTLYAIPEASAHFMVMFCLGMLVRYEPEKWLQILSGKLSSEINLINWFIEISKRKFPNMILNGLLSKEVQFTMGYES